MTIHTRAPRGAAHARPSSHPARCGAHRPRRRIALILIPLLVIGLAACQPSAQQESVRSLVNDSRRAHGVHAISDEYLLRVKAQQWAEHLASKRSLSHSSLTSGLSGLPWVAVAENVGRGSDVGSVHETFMASSRHRANILDRRWDRIGTGHAVGRDGLTYTVHVFVDLG